MFKNILIAVDPDQPDSWVESSHRIVEAWGLSAGRERIAHRQTRAMLGADRQVPVTATRCGR